MQQPVSTWRTSSVSQGTEYSSPDGDLLVLEQQRWQEKSQHFPGEAVALGGLGPSCKSYLMLTVGYVGTLPGNVNHEKTVLGGKVVSCIQTGCSGPLFDADLHYRGCCIIQGGKKKQISPF